MHGAWGATRQGPAWEGGAGPSPAELRGLRAARINICFAGLGRGAPASSGRRRRWRRRFPSAPGGSPGRRPPGGRAARPGSPPARLFRAGPAPLRRRLGLLAPPGPSGPSGAPGRRRVGRAAQSSRLPGRRRPGRLPPRASCAWGRGGRPHEDPEESVWKNFARMCRCPERAELGPTHGQARLTCRHPRRKPGPASRRPRRADGERGAGRDGVERGCPEGCSAPAQEEVQGFGPRTRLPPGLASPSFVLS